MLINEWRARKHEIERIDWKLTKSNERIISCEHTVLPFRFHCYKSINLTNFRTSSIRFNSTFSAFKYKYKYGFDWHDLLLNECCASGTVFLIRMCMKCEYMCVSVLYKIKQYKINVKHGNVSAVALIKKIFFS